MELPIQTKPPRRFLGKGMVETRGLFWTWWIHFLSDIAIFASMAAALLR
jgi:hypothetical protein